MNSLKFSRLSKLGVLLSAIILAGCENTREAIGINKQSPDEFAVVTRAPLSMPPDYGLRPPRPGVLRPQEAKVDDSARNELIRSTGNEPASNRDFGGSQGETALLAKAGATNPDPSIRGAINRESSILATEDDSFADRLIFWQGKQPPGAIVDAAAEQKRLRENAALGDAPTKGRSPTIVRKPKGWFEGIFN